jgi:type VI secretion system protein
MPNEGTLLDRLSQPKAERSRTITDNPVERQRSILQNLQRILNTRTGHAGAQMDLGTPAPGEMALASSEGIGGALRVMKQAIEKYEPRLKSVEITQIHVKDEVLTLRFQITATIVSPRGGSSISFDTLIDPSGRIKLQG